MKQRKIPMRTCVVTKEKYPKSELIRVVRDNLGNISVDLTGKKNGRGAYLKKDIDVINKAFSGKILERYLEALIPQEIYNELCKIVNDK